MNDEKQVNECVHAQTQPPFYCGCQACLHVRGSYVFVGGMVMPATLSSDVVQDISQFTPGFKPGEFTTPGDVLGSFIFLEVEDCNVGTVIGKCESDDQKERAIILWDNGKIFATELGRLVAIGNMIDDDVQQALKFKQEWMTGQRKTWGTGFKLPSTLSSSGKHAIIPQFRPAKIKNNPPLQINVSSIKDMKQLGDLQKDLRDLAIKHQVMIATSQQMPARDAPHVIDEISKETRDWADTMGIVMNKSNSDKLVLVKERK